MMLDESTFTDLFAFRDEVGVLSFYAGFTPEQAANPRPVTPLKMRTCIRELRDEIAEERPDKLEAVERRLEELGDDLGGMLDPKAHGQGRVLFVAVESGERRSFALQLPFTERALFRDRPFVRPLVAAHDEGRPAGIVVAHRKGMRILEWSLGEAEEIETRDFTVGDAQLADIKSGPGVNNPQAATGGLVNRERFEDRIDENRNRFLKAAVSDLVQMASDRSWDRLVVAGAPKIREHVYEEIPDNGVRKLVADQMWETEGPHEIASQVWPTLRSIHRQRELELVDAVKDRALSGGAGALGLADTLAALNQARVQHLLYQANWEPGGYVSEQGTLHAEAENVQGVGELKPVSELLERMIEKALEQSAQATPVDEEAASALGEYGGVGALLRW